MGELTGEEREADDHELHRDEPRQRPVPTLALVPLVEGRPLLVDLGEREQHAVIQAVRKVVDGQPMPRAHEQHVDQVGRARRVQAAREELSLGGHAHEPHEDEVAQPRGQRDVPTVPKVLHVLRRKRGAEILGRGDAEAVTRPHCHERIAGKVEEEIQGVDVRAGDGAHRRRPGNRDHRRHARELRGGGRVEGRLRNRCQHQLRHGSGEQEQDAPTEEVGVLGSGKPSVGVFSEPTRPIDRPRGERREKRQEVQVVNDAEVVDEPIADFDEHLHRLEGEVTDADEAQQVRIEHRPHLVDDERSDGRDKRCAVHRHALAAALPAGERRAHGRERHREKHRERSGAGGTAREEQTDHHA